MRLFAVALETEPRKLNREPVILEINRHTFLDSGEKCNESVTLSHPLQRCDRSWFDDPFLSKEQWAFVIGINRATLYRYQSQIRSDRILSRIYGGGKFTAHQGFILYLFKEVKLKGFYEAYSGKPLWYWTTKDKFYKWRNDE